MTQLQSYEEVFTKIHDTTGATSPMGVRAVREEFQRWRRDKIASIETCRSEWNGAVAAAVEQVGRQCGLIAQTMGKEWHERAAQALRALREPLRSTVILSAKTPHLQDSYLRGRMRAYGTSVLSEDPEFMPSTQFEWPRFPYFQVEPGTASSLARSGLIMLANPPGIDEEEANEVGTPICGATYARSPMISLELDLNPLAKGTQGALLLNWSFKGRQGAMAKIFIDGQLDVPAFEVASTDEDPTPNFWTVAPWRSGNAIVELKHTGSGFLFFEHCDVHHIVW